MPSCWLCLGFGGLLGTVPVEPVEPEMKPFGLGWLKFVPFECVGGDIRAFLGKKIRVWGQLTRAKTDQNIAKLLIS